MFWLAKGQISCQHFPMNLLILFDVVKLDEENYQCVAVNDAGSDSANFTITVWG